MKKYTTKAGTIGRSIEKLVRKCEMNPIQFYILERALCEASGLSPVSVVKVDGKLISETPGYKKAQVEFARLFPFVATKAPLSPTAADMPKTAHKYAIGQPVKFTLGAFTGLTGQVEKQCISTVTGESCPAYVVAFAEEGSGRTNVREEWLIGITPQS